MRLSAKPTLTGLNETLSLDADITGSLDDLRLQAQVADPEADVTGRLGGLGRELTWEVEVRAPALSVPMDGGLAELPPVRLSASARGDTRKLAAEADVDVSGTSMKVGINANVPSAACSTTGPSQAHSNWSHRSCRRAGSQSTARVIAIALP